MAAHWPYFDLDRNGHLTLNGRKPFAADCCGGGPIQPRPFTSEQEAEDWLAANNIRGNVRPRRED